LKLETLVDDIYKLFDPTTNHNVDEHNLDKFASDVRDLLKRRLQASPERTGELRFSALGKKDRQLWYAAKGYKGEDLLPQTYIKFLYGDLLEALVLFLAKEAGHDVSREQEEVEVDGIKGHIDAVIDGVVVDVKSASSFGFKKFKDGSIVEDDPFGYIDQISGYSNVLTPGLGPAFVAIDKVSGDICTTPISSSITEQHKPEERIEHLKEVIQRDEPPARCYDDVPDGKSGNRKLGTECSYCNYKHHCWDNIRTFIYSTGPRFLTKVERAPDVFEVPN
jgi:hypothetical protein